MQTLDTVDTLPHVLSLVEVEHPMTGEKTVGEIVTYTCDIDFEHVTGVNVRLLCSGQILDCRLHDVEVL